MDLSIIRLLWISHSLPQNESKNKTLVSSRIKKLVMNKMILHNSLSWFVFPYPQSSPTSKHVNCTKFQRQCRRSTAMMSNRGSLSRGGLAWATQPRRALGCEEGQTDRGQGRNTRRKYLLRCWMGSTHSLKMKKWGRTKILILREEMPERVSP